MYWAIICCWTLPFAIKFGVGGGWLLLNVVGGGGLLFRGRNADGAVGGGGMLIDGRGEGWICCWECGDKKTFGTSTGGCGFRTGGIGWQVGRAGGFANAAFGNCDNCLPSLICSTCLRPSLRDSSINFVTSSLYFWSDAKSFFNVLSSSSERLLKKGAKLTSE